MLRTVARLFVLPWYLVGWILHLYLGLYAPGAYLPFGATALLPGYSELWRTVVMPHISVFALLLAGFEFMVNRLPNLAFIAIQVPLLLGPKAQPMSDVARGWLRHIGGRHRPAYHAGRAVVAGGRLRGGTAEQAADEAQGGTRTAS